MTTIPKSRSNIYLLSTEEKKKLCEEWQKTGLSHAGVPDTKQGKKFPKSCLNY